MTVARSCVLNQIRRQPTGPTRWRAGGTLQYVIGQAACKTGTSAKAARKDARRQKRRLSLARERDFFLQPPELPDE